MLLRDAVIFLAGAQAFHTVSHLILPMMLAMPLQLKWPPMTFTARGNAAAAAVNAAVTVALIAWATRL